MNGFYNDNSIYDDDNANDDDTNSNQNEKMYVIPDEDIINSKKASLMNKFDGKSLNDLQKLCADNFAQSMIHIAILEQISEKKCDPSLFSVKKYNPYNKEPFPYFFKPRCVSNYDAIAFSTKMLSIIFVSYTK